jgi:hypothetical protein
MVKVGETETKLEPLAQRRAQMRIDQELRKSSAQIAHYLLFVEASATTHSVIFLHDIKVIVMR